MSNLTATAPSNAKSTGLIVVESLKIIIGCLGFCGNLLSFIILKKRTAKNHTNFLILNQCLVDIISSIFLIAITLTSLLEVKVPSESNLDYALCLLWAFSQTFLWSFFAISSFNLAVISLERYIAVVHPVWYMGYFKRSITLLLALICWVLGPVFTIAYSILTVAYGDGICSLDTTVNPTTAKNVLSVFLFFWEYFLPVSIMTFSFVSIARKFWKMNREVAERNLNPDARQVPEANQPSQSRQSERVAQGPPPPDSASVSNPSGIPESNIPRGVRFNRQRHDGRPMVQVNVEQPNMAAIRRLNTTKVLFLVYLAFIICWSPNQWNFLRYNLGGNIDFNGVFHFITVTLVMCNSCVNPIIYAMTMKSFKRDLKRIFKLGQRD